MCIFYSVKHRAILQDGRKTSYFSYFLSSSLILIQPSPMNSKQSHQKQTINNSAQNNALRATSIIPNVETNVPQATLLHSQNSNKNHPQIKRIPLHPRPNKYRDCTYIYYSRHRVRETHSSRAAKKSASRPKTQAAALTFASYPSSM